MITAAKNAQAVADMIIAAARLIPSSSENQYSAIRFIGTGHRNSLVDQAAQRTSKSSRGMYKRIFEMMAEQYE